jgi:lipopolysaccharide export system permease protein
MVLYLLYKIPFILYQIIPPAMLLTVLLSLGLLSRNNEILAMRTSGISIYRIVRPLAMVALVISFCGFLINEYLVPPTLQRSEYLRKVLLKRQVPSTRMVRNRIWFKGEQGIYNITCFEPTRKELQGVILLMIQRPFTLTKRIDASSALWNGKEWVFHEVAETEFGPDGTIKKRYYSEKKIDIPEVPEDFQEIQKETEMMPYFQLRKYIKKIREEGYDATTYMVDLHSKIAFPFLNVITIFIGVPFSLRSSRVGGMAFGVAMSMVIGFIYYVIFDLSVSFGHSGVLPPLFSAWAANILFSILGVYLLLRAETS